MALGTINEGSTATYTAQLLDEQNVGIPADNLIAVTMTYYDRLTGEVINDRDEQDILNENDVTIDENGNISWNISAADTIIVNAMRTAELEVHVVLIQYYWSVGGVPKAHKHLFEINIRQLLKVT